MDNVLKMIPLITESTNHFFMHNVENNIPFKYTLEQVRARATSVDYNIFAHMGFRTRQGYSRFLVEICVGRVYVGYVGKTTGLNRR